jgi:DNA-binding NarL/FixJ family response regulator
MRALIADDHEVVRHGMRALIQTHPGWEVCAECATGREAVQKSAELRPDVAVLDVTMPELDGLEAARQIRRQSPSTASVIFSVHDTEHMVREVLLAGAFGYVTKMAPPQDLLSAIDAAYRRHQLILARSFDCLLRKLTEGSTLRAEGGLSVLSGREREIVQLLANGKTNKEVCTRLGIGLKTVEAHRARIMRKIHAGSAAALVRYAIRNGLVDA